MNTPDADLRTRLRAATADAHQTLEDALDLPRRLAERDTILRVLCGLRGFFAPAEVALDGALGPAVMAGRHRVPALDADLRALGLDGPGIERLSRSPAAGRARSRAAALGTLYVLEGTRLGGRVIGRALARQAWIPAGFSQFWSDEADMDQHWPRFLALLPAEREPNVVVDSALETFDALHAWLASADRP